MFHGLCAFEGVAEDVNRLPSMARAPLNQNSGGETNVLSGDFASDDTVCLKDASHNFNCYI